MLQNERGRRTELRGKAFFRFPGWVAALLLCLGLATPALAGTLAERVSESTLSNRLKVLILEEPKAAVTQLRPAMLGGSTSSQNRSTRPTPHWVRSAAGQ